jgi:hypothetical protein
MGMIMQDKAANSSLATESTFLGDDVWWTGNDIWVGCDREESLELVVKRLQIVR